MANPMFDDDDFDFGGDDGDDNAKAGTKRTFLELEEDDEDVDLYPTKKIYGSTAAGNDHATTTILNLRASLEERESTVNKLQKDLTTANGDLERWRTTFRSEDILHLIPTPEPEVVLGAVQKLQNLEGLLKEELNTTKRREGAMLIQLSIKEREIADLKALVHDLRLMLKPPVMQARRLLLDPAIHAEFTRMKKELEASEKRVKDLQDDLAAVQFTPHSKNGKMLMAKCRTLQEENEEIGREASEGKINELGVRLAVQKNLASELRRGYQELAEYVEDLNDEAERSHQTIYLLQTYVQQRDEKILELTEQCKQAESREVRRKGKQEDRGENIETMRDGGDDNSREKTVGESRR